MNNTITDERDQNDTIDINYDDQIDDQETDLNCNDENLENLIYGAITSIRKEKK